MELVFDRATEGPHRGILRRLLLSALLVGVLGPVAVLGTLAAFTPAAAAQGGGFAAGTVYLTSDTGGRLPRSMPNAGPGSTATSTTILSYEGTLPANVRLFASTSGTGLARFLSITLTRGTGRGPDFVPDPTDYTGAGPGVVYSGTLARFPSHWASGIVDPGTWRQGETHAYRFRVTLVDDPRAQGLTAGASFHWEARSS